MRFTALVIAFTACKPPAPTGALEIGNLMVSRSELASRPELSTSVEEVRASLRDQLEATRRFVVRENAPGQVTLRIDRVQRAFAPVPGQSFTEREMAEVAVSLELLKKGGDSLHADGFARKPIDPEQSLDPSARRATFTATLGVALHEAAAALVEQIDAHNKPDAALIADLGSPDVRARDYAVRVLSERRIPAAVPSLIERLSDSDQDVARAAVGALATIGDKRAVPPLIEAARKRRPDEAGPILYAIASIGGAEAEAFLFTLESGAPDEEVRRAAHEAYADLLRNKRADSARRTTNP
ncbi:MAG TPA: HEAT repeat domain-containing protein [Myxococcales bacterium]|jgi:hypothetical protein|nr:HEAT repeat domain-containing protein [Myxococcales bacterium]